MGNVKFWVREIERNNLNRKILEIKRMSLNDFILVWNQYFSEVPQYPNRKGMERILFHKMQVQLYGDLSEADRNFLINIGKTQQLPGHHRNSDDLLPGTILVRRFNDEDHQVRVKGSRRFEYNNEVFTSLSTIAKKIAGCNWSGNAFFGLKGASKKGARQP